jgi:hypothetical protein
MFFLRRSEAALWKIGAMHIRLAGREFDLEIADIIDRLAGHTPNAVTKYSTQLGDVMWPVKQVLTVATSVSPDEFSSREARSRLRELGLVIDEVGQVSSPRRMRPRADPTPFNFAQLVAADSLNVEVHYQWCNAGSVTLDRAGFPLFPALPSLPGLYRFNFGANSEGKTVLYIGESKELSDRARQYRRAKTDRTKALTSRRLHRKIVEHLSEGGTIMMSIVTEVRLGDNTSVSLGRKSGRLLAESAAVVSTYLDPRVEIVNIDDDTSLETSG